MATSDTEKAMAYATVQNPMLAAPAAVMNSLGFGKKRDTSRDVNPDIYKWNQILSEYKNAYDSGQMSQKDYANAVTKAESEIRGIITGTAQHGQHAIENMYRAGLDNVYSILNDAGMYQAGQEFLGRDLTQSEYAQLAPAWQADKTTGRAALAQYADAYKKTPEYLKTQAGKYSGDVNTVFNDLMKRGATQGELDHFGQMLATGETDLYELSQYVQSLPEFQTAADQRFRTGLADELQGYDTQFFKKTSPEILDQYAKAGIQNSSALDYAMTDLMGNIAAKRGEYLAGLSSQQYGGNKAAAREDYLASLNNYLGNQGLERERAWGLQDYYNKRGDERADYTLQKNDYMNYLNSMKKQKPGLLDYVNTAANVASGIGSFYN